MSTRIISSKWDAETKVLTTRYSGNVTADDAVTWKNELWTILNSLPEGTNFKLLLDLHGFDPIDIQAHKAMRNIIPEVLASHGLRPAFIDLFDEKPEMKITSLRHVNCLAFANVHHEQNKMDDYKRRIGTQNQQFFTDQEQARTWLVNSRFE